MTTKSASEQAKILYEEGNAHRKQQRWAEALNAYEQAAALDPESPAVAARKMLMDIMEFYCKDYYNP
ncbi:MAG: tetratricopeptide repeat protein [Bacteroidaceae bacterium]|nr:tetratricopeptide repeat protein [Bacteroidaceae bacterium]